MTLTTREPEAHPRGARRARRARGDRVRAGPVPGLAGARPGRAGAAAADPGPLDRRRDHARRRRVAACSWAARRRWPRLWPGGSVSAAPGTPSIPGWPATEVAAVTAAAGAWATAGTELGAAGRPGSPAERPVYLAAAGGGYWWLRSHEAVRAARARRDEAAAWREPAKTAWHRLAPLLGLNGSHLLAYDETLLGDTMLIDTRGTGKRASQINGRDVAERLGELEMIPVGRIDVDHRPDTGPPADHRAPQRPVEASPDPPRHRPGSPFARYVDRPGQLPQAPGDRR